MEYILLALVAVSLVLNVLLLLTRQRQAADITAAVIRTLDEKLSRQLQEMQAALSRTEAATANSIAALGQALQANQLTAATAQTRELQAFSRQTADALQAQKETVELLRSTVVEQMKHYQAELSDKIARMDKELTEDQNQLNESVGARLAQLQTGLSEQLEQFRAATTTQLETLRGTVGESMTAIREDNNRRLDEIRGTVDEKLQTTLEKRITESFKTVNEQLQQVYSGLGEMRSLASDVGGLKKVLSGVKTRGILGEIQLSAILEEILSPEQYDTNVATIPGSSERVEFAVKLPAKDGTIYLPIDSKFPGERYAQLQDARDSGDKEAVAAALKALEHVLKTEAADIRSKYVEVPYTTNFGIMFLPFEGLYAEVVNSGLLSVLQNEYKVNVAGPSTMAALLNSLQMGFKTLAIQKRSGEVWEVLGAVKTEFEKFEDGMKKMQSHLSQTSSDLETLMGTRSRAISRKLRSVQQLDDDRAGELLGLTAAFPEE